ncbi:hypothetical protein EVG20_g10887 [Dentipellis fragilis]|uniref:Uncharacterized protein n=1 Tax=Dentipellis fragilis TaxID=205917 RepID=A0A4Y9XNK4_9AGAM|nr:hypothetical protein EVG20_g10887 [Dentipellis fragilis]
MDAHELSSLMKGLCETRSAGFAVDPRRCAFCACTGRALMRVTARQSGTEASAGRAHENGGVALFYPHPHVIGSTIVLPSSQFRPSRGFCLHPKHPQNTYPNLWMKAARQAPPILLKLSPRHFRAAHDVHKHSGKPPTRLSSLVTAAAENAPKIPGFLPRGERRALP